MIMLCVTQWNLVIVTYFIAIQENLAPGVPKKLLRRQSYLRDHFILNHENGRAEFPLDYTEI